MNDGGLDATWDGDAAMRPKWREPTATSARAREPEGTRHDHQRRDEAR
jgi:hypothetical protein